MKAGRRMAFLITLLLLCSVAMAEHYGGKTVAEQTVEVLMTDDGTAKGPVLEVGNCVREGDVLFSVREIPVFATQDGVIADVRVREGGKIVETALTLRPEETYKIYCTVAEDAADEKAETRIVHCGETLYVSCTKNGTHRAVGIVTEIDGNEYRVMTLGGKLYLGETVDLYRSDAFDDDTCVGIGTVVMNDTEHYGGEGTVQRLCVEAGDSVERGQILYTYTTGKEKNITAPVGGILTQSGIREGDILKKDSTVAVIAPYESICVEFTVDEYEVNALREGENVRLYFASDEDTEKSGKIISIDADERMGDGYRIVILPDEICDVIGMDVEVEPEGRAEGHR